MMVEVRNVRSTRRPIPGCEIMATIGNGQDTAIAAESRPGQANPSSSCLLSPPKADHQGRSGPASKLCNGTRQHEHSCDRTAGNVIGASGWTHAEASALTGPDIHLVHHDAVPLTSAPKRRQARPKRAGPADQAGPQCTDGSARRPFTAAPTESLVITPPGMCVLSQFSAPGAGCQVQQSSRKRSILRAPHPRSLQAEETGCIPPHDLLHILLTDR